MWGLFSVPPRKFQKFSPRRDHNSNPCSTLQKIISPRCDSKKYEETTRVQIMYTVTTQTLPSGLHFLNVTRFTVDVNVILLDYNKSMVFPKCRYLIPNFTKMVRRYDKLVYTRKFIYAPKCGFHHCAYVHKLTLNFCGHLLYQILSKTKENVEIVGKKSLAPSNRELLSRYNIS
jgi:hypothetical protein